MNKKKKTVKKKKKAAKKNSTLTLFYAVNAVLTGLLLLYMGVSVAGRNTELNINGNYPDIIYFDEIKNTVSDFVKKTSFFDD